MKKLFLGFLGLLACLSLTACGYKDAMAYHIEVVEQPVEISIKKQEQIYNVLDYTTLTVYCYSQQIDQWYSGGSGSVNRLLKYHKSLSLSLNNNIATIKGTYEYSGESKTYEITYAGDGYNFILNK